MGSDYLSEGGMGRDDNGLGLWVLSRKEFDMMGPHYLSRKRE